jgi:ADP-dependent phosphofructokinase/glucokinase
MAVMATSLTPGPGTAVLGLGGCLDYEVQWDGDVFAALCAELALSADEVVTGDVIHTERELVASILAFMRDGVGGERVVESQAVVEGFARRFAHRVTIGGSSVRAGVAMSAVGVPSTLHLVSIDDQFRAMLPHDVEFVSSAHADSVNPHLIVQYPAGASGSVEGETITATRPNRLIYVSDPPNRDMLLAPELGTLLEGARVFLISGLNAMVDREQLDERLAQLREAMANLPADATVVFEDAGYHVPGFNRVVITALAWAIDVYGMNEDELQAHVGRPVDLLDPVDVVQALREAVNAVSARTLVVHTKHWALAYGERAPRMREALVGGVTMASARYVFGDALNAGTYELAAAFPAQRGGSDFARRLEAVLGPEVCCVPGLELNPERPTTIGLGDAFLGGMLAVLTREAARA